MRVFYYDEFTFQLEEHDISNDIDTFYRFLQCDCIDCVTFWHTPSYRIVAIVDDCGAYYRSPTVPYYDRPGGLYGSVIFCRHYYNSEDFSDIEDEDLAIIALAFAKA